MSAVPPQLAESVAAGSYTIDSRAVADAIRRRMQGITTGALPAPAERESWLVEAVRERAASSSMLEAAQGDGPAAGAQDEPRTGADRAHPGDGRGESLDLLA